jgi:hypothetical protein
MSKIGPSRAEEGAKEELETISIGKIGGALNLVDVWDLAGGFSISIPIGTLNPSFCDSASASAFFGLLPAFGELPADFGFRPLEGGESVCKGFMLELGVLE